MRACSRPSATLLPCARQLSVWSVLKFFKLGEAMTESKSSTSGVGGMNDTLEFVRNFWGSMKIPGMAMPSMSPDDLNKQIADLKAVESWLQMNMNMLRGTIQTLEVQSATLTALHSMSESFAKAASPSTPGPDAVRKESASEQSPGSGDGIPSASEFAAHLSNPAAWWNTVQENFSQVVSQAMTPEKKTTEKPTATPKKRAPRKTKAAPKK